MNSIRYFVQSALVGLCPTSMPASTPIQVPHGALEDGYLQPSSAPSPVPPSSSRQGGTLAAKPLSPSQASEEGRRLPTGWDRQQLKAATSRAAAVANSLAATKWWPLGTPSKRSAIFGIEAAGRSLFLKVPHPSSAHTVANDRQWSSWAAARGFAPAVIPTGEFDDVVLSQRIDGKPLSSTEARSKSILAATMRLLARLHSSERARMGAAPNLNEKAQARLTELEGGCLPSPLRIESLRARAACLHRLLGENPINLTPCHGDFWHANVVVQNTDSALFVVDWDSAGWSDPIAEVARYLTLIDFPAVQAQDPFTEYLGRPPYPNELRRLRLTMALLNIDYYALAGCREGVLTNKPNFAAMKQRVLDDDGVLPALPVVTVQ